MYVYLVCAQNKFLLRIKSDSFLRLGFFKSLPKNAGKNYVLANVKVLPYLVSQNWVTYATLKTVNMF